MVITPTTDRVLKGLGGVLFVVWLGSWGYTALKMLEFSAHTYRMVTLPVSLACLCLWSLTFQIRARAMYRPFSASDPFFDAKGNQKPPVSLWLRNIWTWTPLLFSGVLVLLYLAIGLTFRAFDPSWPSPVLPAEVCFAPMVYFYGILGLRARGAQQSFMDKAKLVS